MAKQAAPVSLTGGAGFNYEDRVAARFLIDMLAGIPPFGVDFGCVSRIEWQARDTGRLLDDLAVTMEGQSAGHTAEFSIKSHRQVTSVGFPSHFVEAAWEEWLHAVTPVFRRDQDLLILVTGELSHEVHESWARLLRESRATSPERMINRLHSPASPGEGSQANDAARALFESLHCPVSLRSVGEWDQSVTVRMLSRVRLLHFDFEFDPSSHQTKAVRDCQSLLNEGSIDDALRLWETLISVAAENRALGGSLDLPTLLSSVRKSFELGLHPDYRSDWVVIGRATNEILDEIQTSIGGDSVIDRESELQELERSLDAHGICLATGESGCGKSTLAKLLAVRSYDSIVALVPEDFEHDRIQQLEDRLGLAHPLFDIVSIARHRCLLLLDSMERLSERGLRLAARLITGLPSDVGHSHVKVLMLMQHDSVQRITARFAESGFDKSELTITPIGYPPESAIEQVLCNVPEIPWATLHRDMRPLLRNLKILDWVVRAARSGNICDSHVNGLIPLIDYLWGRWIESEDRGIAGGGLLKKLGVMEAATLAYGVPLIALEYAEQQALGSLVSAGLVSRRNERIRFSHDLLGDWARLKVLIGEDPTQSSEGLRRSGTARWHRAVRLFGRWLLSQTGGVQRWSAALARSENGTAEGTVVRDLLLEAVAVSDNAHELLSLTWPVLAERDGRLLKVLLDRFMFIATIPELRLSKLGGGGNVAPQIEIAFRTPFAPYWGALLALLYGHRDYVCRVSLGETARICKLWLEKTPVELVAGTPFPWRQKAATLALSVAQEFQARHAEGRYDRNDNEQMAYEAALLAAHDLPEEVAAFALEMASRRPPSPMIRKRAAVAQLVAEEAARRREEMQPELKDLLRTSLPYGPLRNPWPDGPTDRVQSEFRNAVLDETAFMSLATVCPDEAREVLLAVCIEHPSHENPFGSDTMDDCGLESWSDHDPPMYFRGPFLSFFRSCPAHGIDCVLRLVNFATSRWVAQEERIRQRRGNESWALEQDDNLSVVVAISGENRSWLGDRRVFRWYLDWPLDCSIIRCILMALEKWLYEMIDAGDEIESWLEQLMHRSESVAFAGLLIDIGKRQPRYFSSCLRPLLGVPAFYHWEPRILMERASTTVGLMGWWNQPRNLSELAREWHLAPHRKHEMRLIAVWLMFHSVDMDAFFGDCRERWRNELDASPDPSFLRTLIEMFDRQNYRETPVNEEGTRIEFVPPPELSRQSRDDIRRANESAQLLTFPLKCRRILDGDTGLTDGDYDSFWETAKWIAAQNVTDDDGHNRKTDAIAGAVAVLLNIHQERTEADLEKLKWCYERLSEIVGNPPPRRGFDTPDSIGDHDWDCFLAEIGIFLLKKAPDSASALDLVAFGISGYHYGTTRRTMALAHRYRKALGEAYPMMRHLAIRWSLVRRLRVLSEQDLSELRQLEPDDSRKRSRKWRNLDAEATRWRKEHARISSMFVRRRKYPMTLREAVQTGQKETERLSDIRFPARKAHRKASKRRRPYYRRRQGHRKDLGIDDKVIQAAFSWLDLSQADSTEERRRILADVRELLDVVLSSLEPVDEDHHLSDFGRLPDDFDTWVFGHVARAIVLSQDFEQPSALWQPILSQGLYARDWTERFFWDWFSDGFNASTDQDVFLRRWSEMLQFAVTSPHWDPERVDSFDLEGPVFELMGYHFGLYTIAADATFAPRLAQLIPLYELAVRRWFGMPRVANGFARSLSMPGYNQLLRPGIQWLYRACKDSNRSHILDEHEAEPNLISALHRCWERHHASVCTDPDLQSAFLGILTLLASRGNHAAMALRDRLLDSIPRIE